MPLLTDCQYRFLKAILCSLQKWVEYHFLLFGRYRIIGSHYRAEAKNLPNSLQANLYHYNREQQTTHVHHAYAVQLTHCQLACQYYIEYFVFCSYAGLKCCAFVLLQCHRAAKFVSGQTVEFSLDAIVKVFYQLMKPPGIYY